MRAQHRPWRARRPSPPPVASRRISTLKASPAENSGTGDKRRRYRHGAAPSSRASIAQRSSTNPTVALASQARVTAPAPHRRRPENRQADATVPVRWPPHRQPRGRQPLRLPSAANWPRSATRLRRPSPFEAHDKPGADRPRTWAQRRHRRSQAGPANSSIAVGAVARGDQSRPAAVRPACQSRDVAGHSAVASASGRSLSVTCVITASEPSEPVSSLQKS